MHRDDPVLLYWHVELGMKAICLAVMASLFRQASCFGQLYLMWNNTKNQKFGKMPPSKLVKRWLLNYVTAAAMVFRIHFNKSQLFKQVMLLVDPHTLLRFPKGNMTLDN